MFCKLIFLVGSQLFRYFAAEIIKFIVDSLKFIVSFTSVH